MGLKQDIIVVNEYSVPGPALPSGARSGSRGGTPGDYVTRYMARVGATESLAPIRKYRTDVFIQRYMAREEAAEALDIHDTADLKGRMKSAQGAGGVAFGYGQVSMSDDALRAASADIQSKFDAGHTVMKTVLSFDEEYLRKHGIIDKDFSPTSKGDYRGNIDQMKLRLAVMNGLDRTGRMMYDDLRYVGVIQVDTMHVHCHLAMVDAGRGTKAADGTQKGKISARSISTMRRGIDSWLDEKQQVKHLSSAVGYERRNVMTYVKRWAHQQMLRESLPQFLLACLPDDRRKWRHSTNAKDMKKPNRIVRELVEGVLEQPDSPYNDAISRVQRYANYRRKNEGLDQPQWDKIVNQGREKIIERGVNSVYALLRALPKDSLRVKTPMLDVMGLDYEDIAAEATSRTRGSGNKDSGELVEFGFRLRSYSARLDHHTQARLDARAQVAQWDNAHAIGATTEASAAWREFYSQEEGYHARASAKYRSLLNFVPGSVQWQPWVDEVSEYGERLLSLQSLRKDQSLRKMKDSNKAEMLGMDIYGQRGGALMSFGDKDSLVELDTRIQAMQDVYAGKVDDLKVKLATHGLHFGQADAVGRVDIEAGPEFAFQDVKALDLHHMRYDFARDVPVGDKGRAAFQEWASRRTHALADMVTYLESSGQAEYIQILPTKDIQDMATMAQGFAAGGKSLPSEVSALARNRQITKRSATVALGTGLQQQIQERLTADAMALKDDAELDGELGPVAEGAEVIDN